MPRVRLVLLPVLCSLLLIMYRIKYVSADCWYNNNRYKEGSGVATGEPCLNCTCNKGTPVCYLRVCPRLPNPPPFGCILLHKYKTCCPELVCKDRPLIKKGLEARSDPNDLDILDTALGKACVANGSIYSSGSAMDSSSFCEYCYCLKGQQHCVKPKCLLPIEGCVPKYSSHSCCPMHYNCSDFVPSVSTTTSAPKTVQVKCLISGKYYQEGEKILGVGHSTCDNCYCIRGLIRCEPLSCAPPLLGCLPVIRPGECCASSYNCSGTIETRPEPNYGNFPIVSKEYAKLRKEVQKTAADKLQNSIMTKSNISEAYYVIAESPSTLTSKSYRFPSFSGTTRHFTGSHNFNASTIKPFFTNSPHNVSLADNQSETVYTSKSNSSQKMKNSDFRTHNTTSNYKFQLIPTTNKPKYNDSSSYNNINLISVESKVHLKDTTSSNRLVDEVIKKKIDNQNKTSKIDEDLITTEMISDVYTTLLELMGNEDVQTQTQTDLNSTSNEINTTSLMSDVVDLFNSTYSSNKEDDFQTDKPQSGTTELNIDVDYIVIETTDTTSISVADYTTTELVTQQETITLKEVVNSTDCIQDDKIVYLENIDKLNLNGTTYLSKTASPDSNEITVLPEDITIVDLESKVKVSTVTLLPFQKLSSNILEATKDKDSYFDYDFKPTLPPSLPNLRIIPFLPSDALDSKMKSSENKIGYQMAERVTDSSIYSFTSLFSPPVETEGGFVPKHSPLLNDFYENTFPTALDELNAVTPIPGRPIMNQDVCISENREYRHNEPVPSINICQFCVCYYGEIVCQEPPCPLQSLECQSKSNILERLLCCQQIVCERGSMTNEFNKKNTSSPEDTSAITDGISRPDPFRDEPAPNLQTLIGDLKPFFVNNTTTKRQQEHIVNFTTTASANDETSTHKKILEETKLENLLDNDFKFLSNNQSQKIFTSSTQKTTTPIFPTIISNTESIYKYDMIHRTDLHENKTNSLIKSTSNELSPGVGLLKLAGCNIYGRMYRVGKIIFELSGPCLECKCTEIGVQCTPIC